MPTFENIHQLKRILKEEGIFLKPHFSQNILVNTAIYKAIIDVIDPGPNDVVIEIGPGLGFLTEYIMRRVKKVVAIEKDRDFCTYLRARFTDNIKFKLIEQDALEIDVEKLYEEVSKSVTDPGKIHLVGNLPYNITTPIITHYIRQAHPLFRAVFMVQKEVGERLVADAGTKIYGAISVFIRFFSEPRFMRVVKKGNFYPVPSVDSALVRLDFHEKTHEVDVELFTRMVRYCFRTRRKTVLNALYQNSKLPWSKSELATLIKKSFIKETARADELSLEDYVKLYHVIYTEMRT